MPRKRRTNKRREDLDPRVEAWLLASRVTSFNYGMSRDALSDLWHLHSPDVVAEHAEQHPGTRPVRWWEYEAPEPRRRLGGTGTPLHECSAYALVLAFGLPQSWAFGNDEWLPSCTPVDPADPPIYESEAAYLDRLGLLLPGEKRRLRKSDYEPEAIRPPG